jgi:hypothetical protein
MRYEDGLKTLLSSGRCSLDYACIQKAADLLANTYKETPIKLGDTR